MGLGLPASGGDFNRPQIIKYDGRAGRIFRVDRSNASGSWTNDIVEITNGFQAIFDMENIETGWLHFPSGGAPDIRTVKIGQPIGDKPTDKHRTGFRVLVKLGKSCGGDVREMAANSQVSKSGMDDLWDAYVAGVQSNPGKLPIVVLEKTITVKSSGKDEQGRLVESTNYQPVWKITGWIDRPAELSGEPAPKPAEPAQQPAPPPPPPPPSPEPAPQLAMAEGEEF